MAGTRAIFYRDTRGAEPVDEFIDALPNKRAAKIDDFIDEHLNDRPPGAPPSDFPISSQIGGELRELRIRFANTRYRILYQRSDNLIVLLHAFEKNTGAVPKADKRLAMRRLEDFEKRMNAKPRKPPRAAGRDAPVGCLNPNSAGCGVAIGFRHPTGAAQVVPVPRAISMSPAARLDSPTRSERRYARELWPELALVVIAAWGGWLDG